LYDATARATALIHVNEIAIPDRKNIIWFCGIWEMYGVTEGR
jgi:hypothetical protein